MISPLGQSFRVSKVFKRCPLEIQGFVFSADLIELSFRKFNLILGMAWLVEHQVGLDCVSKRVTLKVGDGEEVVMVGERRDYLSIVISTMVAEKLVQKGCDAYLAYVHDTSAVSSTAEGIRSVKDFSNAFPEELSGLPPDREVEANIDDDPNRAEFWLENTIRVFDELSCTPEECMKCVVSLLRDSTYQWWNTFVSVIPKERITWEFFQEEFRKKNINQRFINQKRKEFLELKQGRMIVTEYEREFVRFSKYAWECVSTEAIMCKRFKDGLNEDIRLFVGILELKEFIMLVERACKDEELAKQKRKAMIEARDTRKRPMSKSFQPQSKRSKETNLRMTISSEYSH
ncbi:maturase K [Gossypium australe]|uniref:Maturase K n=1 Tax=Gossypium australe TaxID=47621 RepID=A0A5B6VKM9_9ROSI|nr:maturase K [Gossypium australe]